MDNLRSEQVVFFERFLHEGFHNKTHGLGNHTNGNATFSSKNAFHDFDPTVLIIAICAVASLWCLALFVSTRGCRTCGEDPRNVYRGGVWAVASQQERDRIMARQLQALETAQQVTPEELRTAREAWERQAALRSEFVHRVVPLGTELQVQAGTKSSSSDPWCCAICLGENLEAQEEGKEGASAKEWLCVQGTSGLCNHQFHRHCISGWLLWRNECPICRQVFLKEDLGSEENDKHNNSNYVPPVSSTIRVADGRAPVGPVAIPTSEELLQQHERAEETSSSIQDDQQEAENQPMQVVQGESSAHE